MNTLSRLKLTTLLVTLFLGHTGAFAAEPNSPPLKPDAVLAASAKASVTYEDLIAEISRIPPKDQFEFLMSRQRLAVVVENILINKTLAIEARERGLDKRPEIQAEIRNQIDKVLAKYRGQDVQNSVPKINLEPKAREMYVANPDKYLRPAQIDTWHTLVSIKGRTRAEAMARALEVRARLLKGESKEQIAQEYSDDPSKITNSGNLDFRGKTTLDPVFVATAEKLKVGEYSMPVETDFGIHIIQLKGTIPESRPTYAEAKRELLQEAEGQYLQSMWEKHINSIRNDPTVKVNAEALDAVKPKMPEIPSPAPVQLPK